MVFDLNYKNTRKCHNISSFGPVSQTSHFYLVSSFLFNFYYFKYINILSHNFHLRIQNLGFNIKDSGFNVQNSGFNIQDLGFNIQDLGFRIQY